MRKIWLYILGLSIGVIVIISPVQGANDAGWWNNLVSNSDTLNWSDVFGVQNPGKDLYNLVYAKLKVNPEKTALKELAGSMGLSTDEAQAVIDGSIAPIFNRPDRKSNILTQEDAYSIMDGMRTDFADLRELYELQAVVDTSISPNEIFANGDTSDSGFDLVADLSVIEDVLFLKATPTSIGAPYANKADKPYLATNLQKTLNNYIENKTPAAVLKIEGDSGNQTGENKQSLTGLLSLSDEKAVKMDILDKDVCKLESNLDKALKDFKETETNSPVGSGKNGNGTDIDSTNNDSAISNNLNDGNENNVEPVPKDKWGKPWCISYSSYDSKDESGPAKDGFESLGGGDTTSFLEDQGGSSDAVSVDVGICFTFDARMTTYMSYQPGKSCVKCEVDQINKYLDETLSKSLVPNKATGNIMESAKCKDTGKLLNLQFVTIWNPIPTPPKDDIIFGKNIFEEWNKFINRYTPLGERDTYYQDNNILGVLSNSLPQETSQIDLLAEISKIKAENTAKALFDVKNFEENVDASNLMVFSKNILEEITQMNSLFKNFKQTYIRIDKDALVPFKKKPNKD